MFSPQVYQINSESYITYDQLYGRSLGKDTVENGTAPFSWLTYLGPAVIKMYKNTWNSYEIKEIKILKYTRKPYIWYSRTLFIN